MRVTGTRALVAHTNECHQAWVHLQKVAKVLGHHERRKWNQRLGAK